MIGSTLAIAYALLVASNTGNEVLGFALLLVSSGLFVLWAVLDRRLPEMVTLSMGGYGLADAALTPFVSRLDELAMDWMWARRPNLPGWWDAVRERLSFGTVFDAFPDVKRKAGLQDAGLESREAVEKILAS